MLWQMSHSLHGTRRGALFAIQRLGQDSGGRGLAHAAGAGEEIGMADAIGRDRVRQRLGDVFLADQFVERLRPIAPGDDDVLVRGPLAASAVSAIGGG